MSSAMPADPFNWSIYVLKSPLEGYLPDPSILAVPDSLLKSLAADPAPGAARAGAILQTLRC